MTGFLHLFDGSEVDAVKDDLSRVIAAEGFVDTLVDDTVILNG